MTYPVKFLSAANSDLADAFAWYGISAPGMETDFLRYIDEAVGRLSRSPARSPCMHGEFRVAVVRRYPVAILYRHFAGVIFVAAILHAGSDLTVWQARN